MIRELTISGLKNIKYEKMALKPLTLLTGLNSTAGYLIGEQGDN